MEYSEENRSIKIEIDGKKSLKEDNFVKHSKLEQSNNKKEGIKIKDKICK